MSPPEELEKPRPGTEAERRDQLFARLMHEAPERTQSLLREARVDIALSVLEREEAQRMESDCAQSVASEAHTPSVPIMAATACEPSRPLRHRLLGGPSLAMASVLALIAVIALGIGYVLSLPAWISYTASLGKQRPLALEDGSRITLNTQGVLRVRFTARLREVRLVRGEAFFTVEHDPLRPFRVYAAGVTVVAVGTKFAVRVRAPEQVDILISEGQVVVDTAVPESPIGANTLVRVRGAKIERLPVSTDAIKDALAWRTGRLRFDRTPLEDAVLELNRYNRRQLVIADDALRAWRVNGAFRATDLDSFIASLWELGVETRSSGDPQVILLYASKKGTV